MFSSLQRRFRVDRTLLLSGAFMVVNVAVLLIRDGTDTTWGTVAGWAASVGGVAALGFRHTWPVGVAAVTLVALVVYYPVSTTDGPLPAVLFMIALYNAARSGQLTAVVTLAVVVMLIITYGELVVVDGPRQVDNMTIALLAGWFLSVIAFGHAMRARHNYLVEAEQRALAAERERDVRALQSATEERLRLARELHDVLGHNISLVNIQASAALHRSTKRPGETAELLSALEFARDTSKEALRELRATLGVLRQVDEDAPTAPAAGLERIAELAARAERAGLQVDVETTGEPPVVPPLVSLAAYRIAQESLTNVTRHAHAERAQVRIDYAPGTLSIRVEDDGRGAPEGVSDSARGSGIHGMKERAKALGGELTAHSTENGFLVTAALPLVAPSP